MKVYLAGAINGCTDSECKDWREYIKSKIGKEKCLDPMKRDYRGTELNCIDEIVEKDKEDIDNSTHVLVNYTKPSVGTSMEILYAWERNKPVYIITSPEIKLSPWLIYHSKKIFYSIEKALEEIYEQQQ